MAKETDNCSQTIRARLDVRRASRTDVIFDVGARSRLFHPTILMLVAFDGFTLSRCYAYVATAT
ncbi:MAG: hypothetical protein WBQ22_12610, partial [Bradyrhizobium sp.]